MYAFIAAATHWTMEQVDELELPKLDALQKHWRRFPPVHVMLALFLGYEPSGAPAQPMTEAEIVAELARAEKIIAARQAAERAQAAAISPAPAGIDAELQATLKRLGQPTLG